LTAKRVNRLSKGKWRAFFMPKNTGDQRTVKPSPNLDFKSQITSQDGKKFLVKGIKCSCKKSWCPRCGKKTTIKRFVDRVAEWNWKFVRQIVLTVDHKKYESPEDAIKTINGKRQIANLIRNLERTKGIKVKDWEWVIEWYKNGYPHWHLFLLVDKAGIAGQIGFKNVVQYWDSGYIKESYIKNEKHWKQITGYFEKHGYFDKKKAHQSRLPEWARKKKYTIRRIGGKTEKKENRRDYEKYIEKQDMIENMDWFDEVILGMELGQWFKKKGDEDKELTEGEKLDKCGCETDLYRGRGFLKNYLGRAKIPYKEFRLIKGEYVSNEGYIVELDHEQLNDLIFKIDNFDFRSLEGK
jgi:hypothetical protein